jgi:hypothetical protein
MLLSPVQQLHFLFFKPLPSHKPPPSNQKLTTDRAVAATHATPRVLEKGPSEERHSNKELRIAFVLGGLCCTVKMTFFPPAMALSPMM